MYSKFSAITLAEGDIISVVVGGDEDFLPALQKARRRGVQIALASIRGSCARELADPADRWGVRDFQMIWLDDLVNRLALKQYRQRCCSEFHVGDRWVETPMRPYPGVRFYCSHCRARYAAWNDFPDAV